MERGERGKEWRMRRTVRGVERPRLLFFYPCACATGGPAGANGDGWLGGAASKRESLTPIAGRLPQIEAAASTKTGWDVCVAAAAAGCVAAAAAARRRQGQPPARRRAPHPGPAARPARTIPAPPPQHVRGYYVTAFLPGRHQPDSG